MKRTTDNSESYFVFLMEHFRGILNRNMLADELRGNLSGKQ